MDAYKVTALLLGVAISLGVYFPTVSGQCEQTDTAYSILIGSVTTTCNTTATIDTKTEFETQMNAAINPICCTDYAERYFGFIDLNSPPALFSRENALFYEEICRSSYIARQCVLRTKGSCNNTYADWILNRNPYYRLSQKLVCDGGSMKLAISPLNGNSEAFSCADSSYEESVKTCLDELIARRNDIEQQALNMAMFGPFCARDIPTTCSASYQDSQATILQIRALYIYFAVAGNQDITPWFEVPPPDTTTDSRENNCGSGDPHYYVKLNNGTFRHQLCSAPRKNHFFGNQYLQIVTTNTYLDQSGGGKGAAANGNQITTITSFEMKFISSNGRSYITFNSPANKLIPTSFGGLQEVTVGGDKVKLTVIQSPSGNSLGSVSIQHEFAAIEVDVSGYSWSTSTMYSISIRQASDLIRLSYGIVLECPEDALLQQNGGGEEHNTEEKLVAPVASPVTQDDCDVLWEDLRAGCIIDCLELQRLGIVLEEGCAQHFVELQESIVRARLNDPAYIFAAKLAQGLETTTTTTTTTSTSTDSTSSVVTTATTTQDPESDGLGTTTTLLIAIPAAVAGIAIIAGVVYGLSLLRGPAIPQVPRGPRGFPRGYPRPPRGPPMRR